MIRRFLPGGAVALLAALPLNAQQGTPAAHRHASAAAKPVEVSIVARDYAFTAPDTVPAGLVTFRLRNEGKELHHFWVVRLDQGRTLTDLRQAMGSTHGPPPAWMVNVGGPQPPAPGGESNATLLLTPGNYAALCVIPAADGKMHVMKGMSKAFTVTPARAETAPAATAPRVEAMRADNAVRLVEYGFEFERPLTAGRHTLRIRNEGDELHELVLFRLKPGTNVAQALVWMEKMQGPPPLTMVGGITGLDRGRDAVIQADFTPGEYGLVCFVPDDEDGKPHFVHGMATQISVK